MWVKKHDPNSKRDENDDDGSLLRHPDTEISSSSEKASEKYNFFQSKVTIRSFLPDLALAGAVPQEKSL